MTAAPPLKIVFMGSPDFSVPVLAAIRDAGHDIVAVYSQPPRQAKRGQKILKCPVHARAEELGLLVRTPENFKNPETVQEFKALNADVAVVVAYGLILPQAVLSAPRLGCINVHASLLPRWRGAAPIERAIMAGDTETGISIMQMDKGLDTGPVLAVEKTPINIMTTAKDLHDELSRIGAGLIVKVLGQLATGECQATPQPDDGVTYAEKLKKQEGRLDWAQPAEQLQRNIRALNPRPGVWFPFHGERIKVLDAKIPEKCCNMTPGYVVDDDLTVACCRGALKLLTLQRAGKKPVNAKDFLRGFSLPKGTHLK